MSDATSTGTTHGEGHGDGEHVGAGGYERDPGLAAERTELAWGRSALALLACGAAVAKGLPKVTGGVGRQTVGFTVLGLGALAWVAGLPFALERRRRGRLLPRPVARGRDLAMMAIGTALVGAGAFAVAAFFPG